MTSSSIPYRNHEVGGIYTITCLGNGRVYVGSSIDINRRFRHHRRDLQEGRHKNVLLSRSWNKYGEDAFLFAIVEVVTDRNLLIEREQWWIDCLNSANRRDGFNLSPRAGSSLGVKHSEDARLRMSKAMKGKSHPHTPESRRKISEALRGRKQSAEHTQRSSESRRGRPISEEVKQKISAFFKGRSAGPKSEEVKRKLSEAMSGRTLSIEHRHKISESLKRNGPEVYITNATLSPADVAIIKSKLARGTKGASLAREYGVRPQVISDIKVGRKWSHIPPAG